MIPSYIVNRDVGNTEFLQHHNKNIAPLVGAAAIMGTSSLLGGLFGSSSSKAAAKAQLQAARETNEANYRLAQKQNEWNVEQWNRENEYNTPAAQRARYEEAGINPYFALGNIQSGNADSLMSADLANQQAPSDSAFANMAASGQALGNGIANAGASIANMYYNNQIQQEQVKALQIQNTYDLKAMQDKINSIHYDSEAKRMSNYVYNSNMQSLINITKNQERMSYTNEYLQRLNAVGTSYDIAAKKFTNDNILPAQANIAKMSLNQMIAQIALTKQQERLTEKQVNSYAETLAIQWMQANASMLSAKSSWKNAATNEYGTYNDAWNKNQSTYRENYIFNRTKNDLVKQIKLGVDMLGVDSRNKREQYDYYHASHFNNFMWHSGNFIQHMSPIGGFVK